MRTTYAVTVTIDVKADDRQEAIDIVNDLVGDIGGPAVGWTTDTVYGPYEYDVYGPYEYDVDVSE